MSVAVIGGSGFIGQNLVEYLSKREYEVIPVYFSRKLEHSNAISYEDFITTSKKIDVVVFAGGNSNHNIDNKDLFSAIKRDSIYIQSILERFEISKAILISSAAVYYGYEGPVDETMCPRPNVNYGLSKRVAEMVFEKEVKRQQIQAIVLRLTHAFGKGERETRLFRSIARSIISGQQLNVYGRGESYINPVPIEFFCKVIEFFVNSNLGTGIDYYNVGAFEGIKVREIVEILKNLFDFECVFQGEEKQPVKFITKVEKLAGLGLLFYDVIGSAVNYIQSIISLEESGSVK